MKIKTIFILLRRNWFQVAVVLLLSVIIWQLSYIVENTYEIRDGIEVEIADTVDSGLPRLPRLP